ncbi:MAG: hypothetical protein HUU20_21330 [Pirellulales bacterium]|nr:hypothetical protein [Pirellulales bacterium]
MRSSSAVASGDFSGFAPSRRAKLGGTSIVVVAMPGLDSPAAAEGASVGGCS